MQGKKSQNKAPPLGNSKTKTNLGFMQWQLWFDNWEIMMLIKNMSILWKEIKCYFQVDAIVNTTSPDFDLKNGAVSKSILDAAGKNIQKEIKANAHNALRGEIVITKGHNLKCKAVFHGALEGYDEKGSTQQKSVKVHITCDVL